MDKAGAYGIQGGAALFCTRMVGDYYNVMGLPVCRLGAEPAPCAEPSGRALTNEEALDMAFLRRDPRALANPAARGGVRPFSTP